MKGIIVLEGPDAAGKTTLAKKLVKDYGARYIHLSLRKDMFLWQAAALNRACKLAEDHLVILDRHWISEIVYAGVYRGGSKLNWAARMHRRVLDKHGAVYVICMPTTVQDAVDLHAKMAAERSEFYKPSEQIRQVAERYYSLTVGGYHGFEYKRLLTEDYVHQVIMEKSFRETCIFYNFQKQGDNIDGVVADILQKLLKRRTNQVYGALLNGFKNFAGHVEEAKVCFVGEQANPKVKELMWPFYDVGHSSKFLAEVLNELRFNESEAIWTNALNGEYFIDQIALIKSLKLIIFGNRAEQEMRRRGVLDKVFGWKTICHPSYAKRFNKKQEFKQLLAQTLIEYGCEAHL